MRALKPRIMAISVGDSQQLRPPPCPESCGDARSSRTAQHMRREWDFVADPFQIGPHLPMDRLPCLRMYLDRIDPWDLLRTLPAACSMRNGGTETLSLAI